MRRLPALASLLAVALATALIPGSGRFPTRAQGGTPTAELGFAGGRQVSVLRPGSPPSQSLTTFMADGTFRISDPPILPASGSAPATFPSRGQGVWQPTDPMTAAITLINHETDAQGHFLDTGAASLQVTLGADGNALTGGFMQAVATPGEGTPTPLTPDCALAGTHLAHETRPSLAGADLVGCDLRGSDLRFADLRGANLRQANLTGANLSGANLSHADLAGAKLNGTDLFAADLSEANLLGADLLGAQLAGTHLGGVRWGNTTCPDGTNSDVNGGSCLDHTT